MMEGKYLMPEEYDIYLEGLRRSGVTNMFGASKYLEYEFGLNKKDAKEILASWMKDYEHIDYSMCTKDQFDYDYWIF